jgi:hypothetical protein
VVRNGWYWGWVIYCGLKDGSNIPALCTAFLFYVWKEEIFSGVNPSSMPRLKYAGRQPPTFFDPFHARHDPVINNSHPSRKAQIPDTSRSPDSERMDHPERFSAGYFRGLQLCPQLKQRNERFRSAPMMIHK